MHSKNRAQKWAGKSIALLVTICWVIQPAFAQEKLPIIQASSKKVDVKDGEIFQKGIWNLSPEIKPDIYYVLGPEKEKKVTFYTDIDSISFQVKPGLPYDFIIVLNRLDTCYTRISAFVPDKVGDSKPLPIEPQLLQKDWLMLRKALEENHAGLYRYKDKKQVANVLDSCLSTINHPMTEIAFGTLIRFMLSFLEDGHTGSNLPPELMNYYSETVKMFPLSLWFTGQKAFIACSTSQEFPAGTELLSIDGKPINAIREKLFGYISSDGKIQSRKYWFLNGSGFPYLYNWVFGEKSTFTIEYQTITGKKATINVAAEQLKNSECLPVNEPGNANNLQLTYEADNTAILTIKTFSSDRLTKTGENFPAFLQASFKRIADKKVELLIIDLRGNGGGDDAHGSLLYAYLTDKPFRYFSSLESTTQKFVKKADHPCLEAQEPGENNFKGKVLFLINGLCFSTTADFCAIAKSNHRGQFIGEETGGAYYGNTSGETYRMVLPNSHIRLAIPTIKYTNAVKKAEHPDRGIIPDYVVMPHIREVIEKRDIQLAYALKLAAKNKLHH